MPLHLISAVTALSEILFSRQKQAVAEAQIRAIKEQTNLFADCQFICNEVTKSEESFA